MNKYLFCKDCSFFVRYHNSSPVIDDGLCCKEHIKVPITQFACEEFKTRRGAYDYDFAKFLMEIHG